MTAENLKTNHIYQGDSLEVLKTFPDECIDTIITSPPYYNLRDYGVEGQLGLEQTLEEYLEKLLTITAELKRVLKPSGVMFWDHGDCYNSTPKGNTPEYQHYEGSTFNDLLKRYGDTNKTFLKTISAKCLLLQNYRLIIRMIDEQKWILRNSIIWHKPNPMPSSVRDRFSNSYEPVYMLTKNKKYFFDLTAVRVPHKQESIKRSVRGYKSKKQQTGQYSINVLKEHSGYEDLEGKLKRGELRNVHPNGKNPGDVWNITTEPFSEAHFATFPEKLIKPMILSSCPENVCKKCGKPRDRIKEVVGKEQVSWGVDRKARVLGKSGKPAMKNITKTVGWSDCGCNAGWEKGLVLDPFLGSGTTALVALKHNRNFVGIELNPDYIKIAEKRIASWIKQTRLEDFIQQEVA